jgi:predicted nucleic acid-binding protein
VKRAVIDASVAVKLIADEMHSDRATWLYETTELVAPSLLHAEVASALTRKITRGDLSAAEATTKMDEVVHSGIRTVPDEHVAVSAVALSAELGHSVYDCFYLALAIAESIPLVTADRTLVNAASAAGYADGVLWIEDVA